MTAGYRVRNWGDHFEISQTRRVDGPLKWVAIPTAHDGLRFRRLMRLPNGAAIYGVWILLVTVAARCKIRGTLSDVDGPLDAESLALKTDAPVDLVKQSLEILSSPAIGWLETVPEYRTESSVGERSEIAPSALGDRSEHAPRPLRADSETSPAECTPQDSTGQDKTNTGTGAKSPSDKTGIAATPPALPEAVIQVSDSAPGSKTDRKATAGPAKPPRGPWASLTSEMITDAANGNPGALLRHWQYCKNLGVVPDVESGRLEFLSVAVSVCEYVAKTNGGNPAALFVKRWSNGRKGFTTNAQEEQARQILRRFDAAQRKPAPEAVEAANAMRSAATAEEVGIYMDGGDE